MPSSRRGSSAQHHMQILMPMLSLITSIQPRSALSLGMTGRPASSPTPYTLTLATLAAIEGHQHANMSAICCPSSRRRRLAPFGVPAACHGQAAFEAWLWLSCPQVPLRIGIQTLDKPGTAGHHNGFSAHPGVPKHACLQPLTATPAQSHACTLPHDDHQRVID